MIDFEAVVDILKQYVIQFMRLNYNVLSATSSSRSGPNSNIRPIRDAEHGSRIDAPQRAAHGYGAHDLVGSGSPREHGDSSGGESPSMRSEENAKTQRWIRNKCLATLHFVDPAGTGVIDRQKMRMACTIVFKFLHDKHDEVTPPTPEWFGKAFNNFDTDGDGLLNYEEIIEIVEQYVDALHQSGIVVNVGKEDDEDGFGDDSDDGEYGDIRQGQKGRDGIERIVPQMHSNDTDEHSDREGREGKARAGSAESSTGSACSAPGVAAN